MQDVSVIEGIAEPPVCSEFDHFLPPDVGGHDV